jgi:hypothetical protein
MGAAMLESLKEILVLNFVQRYVFAVALPLNKLPFVGIRTVFEQCVLGILKLANGFG